MEAVPIAQRVQAVAAVARLVYPPSAQVMHEDCPVAFCQVPEGQLWHRLPAVGSLVAGKSVSFHRE